MKQTMLASDIDGTLMPLEFNNEEKNALVELKKMIWLDHSMVTFVTGRDFEAVIEDKHFKELPTPGWIICDVGTSIYAHSRISADFNLLESYQEHLGTLVGDYPVERLSSLFRSDSRMRKQEERKQGKYKLSYYTEASMVDDVVADVRRLIRTEKVPYSVIGSVDPFNNDGLIDMLPENVDKGSALKWLCAELNVPTESVVFCGDSGNDLGALTSGVNAVLVGNASDRVRSEFTREMESRYLSDRVFLAQGHATVGVLEGWRHYNGMSPSA